MPPADDRSYISIPCHRCGFSDGSIMHACDTSIHGPPKVEACPVSTCPVCKGTLGTGRLFAPYCCATCYMEEKPDGVATFAAAPQRPATTLDFRGLVQGIEAAFNDHVNRAAFHQKMTDDLKGNIADLVKERDSYRRSAKLFEDGMIAADNRRIAVVRRLNDDLADLAKEYQNLKKDRDEARARDAEIDDMRNQRDMLGRKITSMAKERDQAMEAAGMAEADLSNLRREVDKLRAESLNAFKLLDQTGAERTDLQTKLALAEQAHSNMQHRARQEAASFEAVEKINTELEKDKEMLRKALDQVTKERERSHEQQKSLVVRIEYLENELAAVKASRDTVEQARLGAIKQIDFLRENAEQITKERDFFSGAASLAQEQRNHFEKELQATRVRTVQAEDNYVASCKEHQITDKTLGNAIAQFKDLQEKFVILGAAHERLKQEASRLSTVAVEHEKQLEEATARVTYLDAMMLERGHELDKMHHAVDAARKDASNFYDQSKKLSEALNRIQNEADKYLEERIAAEKKAAKLEYDAQVYQSRAEISLARAEKAESAVKGCDLIAKAFCWILICAIGAFGIAYSLFHLR